MGKAMVNKTKKSGRSGAAGLTRNGYLNFLKSYKRCHSDLTAQKMVIEGAKAWRKLDHAQKKQYKQQAKIKGKVSLFRTNYKCQKLGKTTKSAYLNFLRDYKLQMCGLSPQDMVRCGAVAWRNLPMAKKAHYQKMAKPNKAGRQCNKKRAK